MSSARCAFVAGLTTFVIVVASSNHAVAATTEQRAAAETLFEQARQLMDQKDYAAACEKFAGSQELDPGLGTMLHLADCYDAAGKTASAWAVFRDAAMTAKRAGDADRERIARERATDLEPRLSRLELNVAKGQADGFELRLNGVAIPRASWGTPLPVDPGSIRLDGSAPGKQPWHREISTTTAPALERVAVPLLQDAPASKPSANGRATTTDHAPSSSGSLQRTMGYVTGVTGLVALAVGGFLGYRAYALNQKSKGDCRADDANACTSSGVQRRDDAKRFGNASTITSAAGGVLAASGLVLLLTAPSTGYAAAASPRSASLSGLAVTLEGRW